MSNKTKYFLLITFILSFIVANYFHKEALAKEMAAAQKSDEVITVSNPKTPVYKKRTKMRMVFEEELSIGVAEGDENYMFGGRVYFKTDDEGNFYVVDWDRKRIQKYDPQGKYLLTMGRKGQGPGEFINIWDPKFDKDKNLYVMDIANHRVSFFNEEGKFVKQIKVPADFHVLGINSRGFYFASQSKQVEEAAMAKWISVYGIFDEKLKSIAEIHRGTIELKNPSGGGAKSRAQFLADIFGADAFKPNIIHFFAENDFIYFGYPVKYEISVYSPHGKLARVIQREFNPIRVTEKHKKDFVSFLENEYFRVGVREPEDIKKQVYQLIEYPKYIPAYKQFTLMENGWLAVVVDSIENDYTLIDIFDEEGKYIAHFSATIPVENLFFKNGKAYALATENDYKFVKRYKFEIQEFWDKRWVKAR
jgi:hypothetical protein